MSCIDTGTKKNKQTNESYDSIGISSITSICLHHSKQYNQQMVPDHYISFQFLSNNQQTIDILHELIFLPKNQRDKQMKTSENSRNEPRLAMDICWYVRLNDVEHRSMIDDVQYQMISHDFLSKEKKKKMKKWLKRMFVHSQ